MGIDVINKVVTISDNHERLVVTNSGKLFPATKNKIKLQAVFRRRQNKGSAGDGNPLIYALKELKGFSITTEEKDKLEDKILVSLNSHTSDFTCDNIIILPSSKPIAKWLGKLTSEVICKPIMSKVFIKATNQDVLDKLQQVKPSKEVNRLISYLMAQESCSKLSMKYIKTADRTYINPILLNPTFTKTLNNVLLIDDLVSTGSSFISCRNELLRYNPDMKIKYLSLLGPVTS